MEQILAPIGDAIGSIFSSPVLQLGLRAIGIYLAIIWIASAYWAFRDMQQRSDNAILPYLAAAGVIVFTPSSSCLRSGSTRSSGRTKRSARSGSATWPRRPSSPRSSRSITARPAIAESTMNGSSAQPAGPGSTGYARTAAAWLAWTGRCAPGAGKDFERRPAAAVQHRRAGWPREAADRLTAAADQLHPGAASASAAPSRTVRTAVGQRAAARRAHRARPEEPVPPVGPQDPLPER